MTSSDLSSPLKIAIIGYGDFGRFTAAALGSSQFVQVVAVSDRVSLKESLYRSLDDILADSTVEAVHITTPPSSHAELAIATLRAGKHVVVDKPLALTPTQGRAVLRAAKKYQRTLAVNYVLRYNTLFHTLQQMVIHGLFGPLRTILLENIATTVKPATHWFWDLKQSGGIHVEHGVHFFDAVSYLLGKNPLRTEGKLIFRAGKNTEAFAFCGYPDGVQAHFYHSFLVQDSLERTQWRLVWDRAQVEIEGWIPQRLTVRAWATTSEVSFLKELGFDIRLIKTGLFEAVLFLPEKRHDIYVKNVQDLWEEVALFIRGTGKISASGEAGLASLITAHQASHRRIELA